VKTDIPDLQALHQLDRATAGLVLFSVQTCNRHLYHPLFNQRVIHKTYQAIARVDNTQVYEGKYWEVKNRLIKPTPRFLMQESNGQANSHSIIKCIAVLSDKALFELNPITGKTQQLRLHMQSLGMPILNDKYYPTLQTQQADSYSEPLQLLAKSLHFVDPLSQQTRVFNCATNLRLDQSSAA